LRDLQDLLQVRGVAGNGTVWHTLASKLCPVPTRYASETTP
jgi:hypothetical protein